MLVTGTTLELLGEIWPVLCRRSDYKIITAPSDFQIYEAMNNLNNFAGQTQELDFNSWAGKKKFHLTHQMKLSKIYKYLQRITFKQ